MKQLGETAVKWLKPLVLINRSTKKLRPPQPQRSPVLPRCPPSWQWPGPRRGAMGIAAGVRGHGARIPWEPEAEQGEEGQSQPTQEWLKRAVEEGFPPPSPRPRAAWCGAG